MVLPNHIAYRERRRAKSNGRVALASMWPLLSLDHDCLASESGRFSNQLDSMTLARASPVLMLTSKEVPLGG